MTHTDNLKKTGKATGTFYFKKFKVQDGRSTMKVGTDAVLLGAVAEISGVSQILEVGTGCGVIALMLAQRSGARIDAIEIDEESVGQATENASASPWNDRINIIQSSLQDYVNQTDKKYDLIISNPPFFSKSLKSPNDNRNISRHNDSLSFSDLISYSFKMMKANGSLWVILPVKEFEEFIVIASHQGLFIHYQMKIFPKEGQCQRRNIIQLKKIPDSLTREDLLFIKNADGTYSEEYQRLTKDFYLDF